MLAGSRLIEAVAILDCNVIPPFTTARDDGGGIEVIGAVKPQAGHHKAALYELCAATFAASAANGFSSRLKAQCSRLRLFTRRPATRQRRRLASFPRS